MTPSAEIEPGPHWWKASALTTWWKASALTTRPTLAPVLRLKDPQGVSTNHLQMILEASFEGGPTSQINVAKKYILYSH